jgi:hypothetical protein
MQGASERLAPIFSDRQFAAMNRWPLLLLVIWLVCAAAGAGIAADTHPDWLRRPDEATLAKAWPKPATHDGRSVESPVVIPVNFHPYYAADQSPAPAFDHDGLQPLEWRHWLIFGGIVSAWVGWSGWIFLYSPPSDPPRIRRDLEVDGAKVVSVTRNGTRLGGRYRPSYRVYSVAVRERTGETLTRQICVKVTLVSDPTVVEATTSDFIWFKTAKPKTPPSPFGKLDL